MKRRYVVLSLAAVLALALTVPAFGGPTNIVSALTKVKKTANKALKQAQAASAAAAAAQTTANAAGANAYGAGKAAKAAQTTANEGVTLAKAAQTTANSALSTANSAKTDAAGAKADRRRCRRAAATLHRRPRTANSVRSFTEIRHRQCPQQIQRPLQLSNARRACADRRRLPHDRWRRSETVPLWNGPYGMPGWPRWKASVENRRHLVGCRPGAVRQTVELKDRLAKSSLVVCLILITTTAALSGCGGSGSGSSSTLEPRDEAIAAAPDPATTRRAEAICRRATAEAAAVAANLARKMQHSSSAEQALTEGLVRPGIRILEREGAALATLHPDPESARVLDLRRTVRTGGLTRLSATRLRRSRRLGTSQELENLTASLTTEQAKLAAGLGLSDCETGFFKALGTAQ